MEVPKMEPALIGHLLAAGRQKMTSLSRRERYVTFLSAAKTCILVSDAARPCAKSLH